MLPVLKVLIHTSLGLILSFLLFLYYYGAISELCLVMSLISIIIFTRLFVIPGDADLILQFNEQFGKGLDSLKGNVIWITGASCGIGESLALYLSTENVKLVLSARSEDKLKQVKKKCMAIGKLCEDDILVVPFDMLDYDKHEWAFHKVLAHFKRLDILVSNAGRGQRGRWDQTEIDIDKAIFELNVFSLVNLARIVNRYFSSPDEGNTEGVPKPRGGHHVVMASIAGKLGAPFSAPYTGSKFALMGYFETLRIEHGCKGVKITLVCPGPVESNFMNSILAEKKDEKPKQLRSLAVVSGDRCAHLCVVAMANALPEVWISRQPILAVTYACQYASPVIAWLVSKIDFASITLRMRDGSSQLQTGTKIDSSEAIPTGEFKL